MDFLDNLNQMQQNFQRKKSHDEKLPKPIWLTNDDSLSKIYTEKKSLWESGEIHYAHLVQANTILFSSFPPLNCPGNIIIGISSYFDYQPTALSEMAINLFRYKNTSDAPDDIKTITDSITDEYERLYNVLLPGSYTRDQAVYFTTVMFYRKHLPKRKLIGSIFPVITNPQQCQSSLILPKRYWTKEFKNYYLGKCNPV